MTSEVLSDVLSVSSSTVLSLVFRRSCLSTTNNDVNFVLFQQSDLVISKKIRFTAQICVCAYACAYICM